jgi:predicted transcriptional regulator
VRSKTRFSVGGSALDDAAAFVNAWERAEDGGAIPEELVSFESWEGLSAVMSGERIALLLHLHATPETSDEALARALSRDRDQVASDLHALEEAGLVDRSRGVLRVTADSIETKILL